MGWARGVSIVALACVGWGLAPQRARACICLPTSHLVAPMANEHPVGVPLVFEHSCAGAGLETWIVTVDGMPATLIASDVTEGFHGVAIEPTPAEGADVVLMESCAGLSKPDGCVFDDEPVERARFSIGAPDLVAPAPPRSIVVEHEAGMFGRECGDPETFDLAVTSEVELVDLEPGAWAVVTFLLDGEPIQVEERLVPQAIELQSSVVGMASDFEGREVCVEVETRDASGNASAVRSECTAIPVSASRGCTIHASSSAPLLVLILAPGWIRRRRTLRSSP